MKNSTIFGLEVTTVSPAKFYATLSVHYPDTIGAVPAQQGSVHGTAITFGSVEARIKACSIGIVVDGFTIIGTLTLPAPSSVYRLSLYKLSIQHPNELTLLLTDVLNVYGHVQMLRQHCQQQSIDRLQPDDGQYVSNLTSLTNCASLLAP